LSKHKGESTSATVVFIIIVVGAILLAIKLAYWVERALDQLGDLT
jgi:HAMP domain-containing protein